MKNNLPRAILFQEDEKALNYRYKLPFTLNADIAIKSIEYDLEDFENSGFKLVGPRPTKGAIYYLHPYKDNEYMHESCDEIFFLKQKLYLYIEIARLLGAKFIKTKIYLTESEKLEVEVDGNVKVKLINIDVNVKNSTESSYKETLEIDDRINDTDFDDSYNLNKNIDTLKDLIDKYNLHHELDLINLIDARDSRESGVKISARTIKTELSSEYRSLLTASAQLSLPTFSVSANFKRSLETLNKVNIHIELIF